MAELGDFLISSEAPDVEVTVDMMDYHYVNECKDVKKLRAILKVLESGKEGHYPHLIQTVQDNILALLPEKDRQRILRMKKEVSPQEIYKAEEELEDWEKSISQLDSKMKKTKADIFESQVKPAVMLPPPRGSKPSSAANSAKAKPSAKVATLSGSKSTSTTSPQTETTAKKAERISGYNFRAWEKFDVDAAVSAMDEEEKVRASTEDEKRRLLTAQERDKQSKREQRFAQELESLRNLLSTHELSQVQREQRAERERTKGNEAYRIGDNDEAYACYSRSLAYDSTPANFIVYANRAMASLRMDKLESAEDDCCRALQANPSYVKAWGRRGTARMRLGKYAGAIEDFIEAVRLEPDKMEFATLLNKAKEQYRAAEGIEYGQGRVQASREFSSGTAVITVISVNAVQDFLLPERDAVLTASGKAEYVAVGSSRVSEPPKQIENVGNGVFSRIPISEDEDDDDDEDGRDGRVEGAGGQDSSGDGRSAASATNGSFVRVNIVEEDSEDSGDEGEAVMEDRGAGEVRGAEGLVTATGAVLGGSEGSPGFTRVLIEESDDDDDVEEEAPMGGASADLVSVQVQEKVSGVDSPVLPSGNSSNHVQVSKDPVDVAQVIRLKEKGNALMQAGDVGGAILEYGRCLALDPHCWAALCNRALALIKSKRFYDAIADCDVLLSCGEHHGLAVKTLFRRAQARVGLAGIGHSTELSLALLDVDTLLGMDPSNAQALKLKEEILLLKPTPPPLESAVDVTKTTTAPPVVEEEEGTSWKVETLRRKAIAYMENSQLKEAVKTLRNALSLLSHESASNDSEKLPLLHLLVKVEMAEGRYEAARGACDEIMAIDPRNVLALTRRASACLALNDPIAAKRDALIALRVDPSSAEAMSLLDSLAQPSARQEAGEGGNAKPKSPVKPVEKEIAKVAPTTAAQVHHEPSHTAATAAAIPASSMPTLSQEVDPSASVSLKDKGNAALKAQDYAAAVEYYSQALQKDPSNIAAVSNRALAYLKMNNFNAAEKDASQVLSADLTNEASLRTKALYRRALARKGIAGPGQLQAALADLDLLMALEPSNKEAAAEIKRIETLLQGGSRSAGVDAVPPVIPPVKQKKSVAFSSSQSSPATPTTATKVMSEPANVGSDLGLSERSTRRKEPGPVVNEAEADEDASTPPPPPHPPIQNNIEHVAKAPTEKSAPSSSSVGATSSPSSEKKSKGKASVSPKAVVTASATAALLSSSAVPSTPPKTAYEMERIWRGIRSRPDLVAQYVKIFKKSTYSRVFTDTVTPDLLSSLLLAVRDHIVETDPAVAVAFLSGFSTIPKFTMTMALLPNADQACVTHILSTLDILQYSPDKVAELKGKYNC